MRLAQQSSQATSRHLQIERSRIPDTDSLSSLDPPQAGRVTSEIVLDNESNRTGDVWHIMLPAIQKGLFYGQESAVHFSVVASLNNLAQDRFLRQSDASRMGDSSISLSGFALIETLSSPSRSGFRVSGLHQEKDYPAPAPASGEGQPTEPNSTSPSLAAIAGHRHDEV